MSGAALTSVIGLAGTIWGVSQLYVALDVAFSRIWSDHPERDVFRRTARGFLWVAILIGAVIVPDRGDHGLDRARRARSRGDPGRPVAERRS